MWLFTVHLINIVLGFRKTPHELISAIGVGIKDGVNDIRSQLSTLTTSNDIVPDCDSLIEGNCDPVYEECAKCRTTTKSCPDTNEIIPQDLADFFTFTLENNGICELHYIQTPQGTPQKGAPKGDDDTFASHADKKKAEEGGLSWDNLENMMQGGSGATLIMCIVMGIIILCCCGAGCYMVVRSRR